MIPGSGTLGQSLLHPLAEPELLLMLTLSTAACLTCTAELAQVLEGKGLVGLDTESEFVERFTDKYGNFKRSMTNSIKSNGDVWAVRARPDLQAPRLCVDESRVRG